LLVFGAWYTLKKIRFHPHPLVGPTAGILIGGLTREYTGTELAYGKATFGFVLGLVTVPSVIFLALTKLAEPNMEPVELELPEHPAPLDPNDYPEEPQTLDSTEKGQVPKRQSSSDSSSDVSLHSDD